ncbi:MAG: ankyrin repeat domain-containing protein [Candidatus Eisenbacteria bacterium]|nr:ankyrin repeat domain-containing protein [Candidatus Eisenbacteria bacterium]
MSGPDREPAAPTFERLRRQAKRLLRDCRRGDAPSLARVRAALPRLAPLDDAPLAAQLRLADVQHALAREAGLENWAALKRHVESAEPFVQQVARFLRALGENDAGTMRHVLERFPAVASSSLQAACAACDPAAAESWIARDPSQVLAGIGGNGAWTPLVCLAQSPLFGVDDEHRAASVAIGERLLAMGADPDTSTPQPDNEAIRLSVLYRASERGNAGLVRLLLERGANPNDGESVYHAAERNHRDVLELLLAHGAEISAAHPHWRNTALYYLAGHRDGQPMAASAREGMRWLLDRGAEPNVPSHASLETPLHRVAALGPDAAVVRLLLERGADPRQQRADGRTAHDLAVRAGNTEIAGVLRAAGAAGELRPVDAFLGACAAGDETRARALLDEHNGLLETVAATEREVFLQAVTNGRVEALRLLVSLGLVAANESGPHGTLLHWAAWHGRAGVVQLLLERGAEVNVRDPMYGSSPLAWAAHGSQNCRNADEDYIAVIDALLASGVDRALTLNKWGEPPEGLASEGVAEHLRERGFAPAES